MDAEDVYELIGKMLLVAIVTVVSLVLYLTVILLCGWAVEWALGLFNISINKTLYWTGIALLILFCAFGKAKVEKSD